MFYRVHQFIKIIFSDIDSSEITWALDNLPPEACSLFLKQSRSEQRHALDVAQSLMKEKNTLTLSNSLLHSSMIVANPRSVTASGIEYLLF
jgi:hypothetical protein